MILQAQKAQKAIDECRKDVSNAQAQAKMCRIIWCMSMDGSRDSVKVARDADAVIAAMNNHKDSC